MEKDEERREQSKEIQQKIGEVVERTTLMKKQRDIEKRERERERERERKVELSDRF